MQRHCTVSLQCAAFSTQLLQGAYISGEPQGGAKVSDVRNETCKSKPKWLTMNKDSITFYNAEGWIQLLWTSVDASCECS